MLAKIAFVSLAAATLAACGSGDGTSISINAAGDDGDNMTAAMTQNGQLAINLPGGFSGNIKLPKLKINAENFDMNGVKLFPGSTISSMNIDAKDNAAGKDSGKVRIAFESPATPTKVRDWFLDKLSKEAGFTIAANGNALTGTTDEKQPFRLDLAADGADKSKGTIVIGE